MRTLAPIRVRKSSTFEGRPHWRFTCRFCGSRAFGETERRMFWLGLSHLKLLHPWPWSEAQLDTDGGVK